MRDKNKAILAMMLIVIAMGVVIYVFANRFPIIIIPASAVGCMYIGGVAHIIIPSRQEYKLLLFAIDSFVALSVAIFSTLLVDRLAGSTNVIQHVVIMFLCLSGGLYFTRRADYSKKFE